MAGDYITSQKVVLGGQEIPWEKFTNNSIFPHLISILGEKYDVKPSCNKTIIRNIPYRVAFLWPVLTLILWYLPLFFIELPEEFNLKFKENTIVTFGACWLLGITLAILSYFERKEINRDFESFKKRISLIKKSLNW